MCVGCASNWKPIVKFRWIRVHVHSTAIVCSVRVLFLFNHGCMLSPSGVARYPYWVPGFTWTELVDYL